MGNGVDGADSGECRVECKVESEGWTVDGMDSTEWRVKRGEWKVECGV